MVLINYLPLLAGLGLFLYGMTLMGSSLEKIAGSRMEKTLERLTTNRFSGVLLGTAVTAVIQSSSATTVMVVGFVNAGIMKLSQAVSVIMGANIGTTATAQIIRLSQVGGGDIKSWMVLFKPSTFAPVLVLIGAGMILFSKKNRTKYIGEMFLGFGILFFGMNVMESTLSQLKDSPALAEAFTHFENPLVGIAMGAGVTALIQSSSASIGILQALSTTGAISFSMMVPIVLGQNIGTCITVILASIGANRNAKRAAVIHLSFNVIGSVIFFVAIYGWQALVGIPFFNKTVNMGDIANFHTIFNIVNVIILLPFCNGLVKMARIVIRSKGDKEEINLLDERFLATPSVAVDLCRQMTHKMGQAAATNLGIANELLISYDRQARENLNENERFCDKTESNLTGYLIKLTSLELSDEESRMTSEMFHSLSDFERISDRTVNIAQVAEYNIDNNVTFSGAVMEELKLLGKATQEIVTATVHAYENMNLVEASHIEPFEEVIDELTAALKSRHVDRLQSGICTIQAGISFMELLTNYERIADHCSNIGIYIIQLSHEGKDFDRHEHLKQVHRGLTQDYKTYYADYEERYFKPLQQIDT